jgi:pyruvate/2-oxoglutarate dehydrogenase complex dihydrolipoamide acyltransferase (E2) component
MAFEFKLPDLGEGVHEGEVVRWLVGVGDVVAPEQPVVEVMTDKVTAELPTPVGGTVLRLGAGEGEIVQVGEVLIAIDTDGAAPPAPEAAAEEEAAPPAGEAEAPAPGPGGKALAVPAVRRLARELGVDLAAVNGTGPGGRVTESDVRAAAAGAPAATPAAAPPETGGPTRRVPLRGMRRVIAEHLLDAHRNTAPYTFVEEVDFTELVRLRERVQPLAQREGVRVTYLPFIIAGLGMALKEHPTLNARADQSTGDLVLYEEQHVALAIHTEEGLVVPVIRNVERRNLLDLSREIERLSRDAREGRLTLKDLQGGTFSVTSLGVLGGIFGTPMLNTPQVAVLGVHQIAPRPVVRNGEVVPRQIANLSLTLDHRYIDGYVGANFAQTLKRYLEDPALMLFWLAEMRGLS